MNTMLIDTSGDPSQLEKTKFQITTASSVVLVYDITSEDTVERLTSYWLPLIQEINSNCPILIVGSKLDKVKRNYELSYFTRVSKIIRKIMRDFPQVQMGLDCSSKEVKNVPETLYCAQIMIQHPLRPLMDQRERTLTPKYKKALTRLFRILDKDSDGLLNDIELSSIQEIVFGSSLALEDLKGLKDVVQEETPEEYSERGVNLKGFFAINKRMLEMMKIKNCWVSLIYLILYF